MQEPGFGQGIQAGGAGGGQGIQNPYQVVKANRYLGETMGPAGMDMPSYMNRPGPGAYEDEYMGRSAGPGWKGRAASQIRDAAYGVNPVVGRLAKYLRQIGYFNEGGAVGLEPGIGSLMGRI